MKLPKIFLFSLIIFLVNSVGYAQTAGGPWPQYGQNAQNTSMSSHEGPEKADILWKSKGASQAGAPILDKEGNIYVTSGFKFNVFNSDGSLRWETRHESSGSTPALHADSIIYTSPVNGPMYAMNKKGKEIWSYKHEHWGVAYGKAGPSTPTIGESGNMYFCYFDTTATTVSGYAIYSFTSQGELNWTTTTKDRGYAPAIGQNDNIYVAGSDTIQAFDPEGTLIWDLAIQGEVNHPLAVDSSGYVYFGTNQDSLGMVYALNSSGEVQWKKQFSQPIMEKPAIYTNEMIYVSKGQQLVAIDNEGDIQWTFQADGHVAEPSVDQKGTVYFGASDSTLYAVDKSGELHWTVKGDTASAFADKITIGANRTLYINSTGHQFYAIGNADSVSSNKPPVKDVPNTFKLKNNFPNPFNPTTTLRYELPEASKVKLAVFNTLGRKVKTLVDKRQQAGSYSVSLNGDDMSSGVYLYRITAGEYTEVRKMTLIK